MVEFGIGNARKVDPLLTALGSSVFAALDISLSALKEALSGLAARHPNTAMVGICCDHTRLQQLPPHPALEGQRRIGFFPGSSLGNFTPEEAVDFLCNARQLLALSLIHISEPTRRRGISYAVFCLKKKIFQLSFHKL